MSARSEQRKKLLEWAVPQAIEIAAKDGWVSPRALIEQLDLTRSDAQIVLDEAQRLGLLYQAVSGRCFLYPEQPYQIFTSGPSDFAANVEHKPAAEAMLDDPRSKARERTGLNVTAILSFFLAAGVAAWFYTTHKDSDADLVAPSHTFQLRTTTHVQPANAAATPEHKPDPDINLATAGERNSKHQKKDRRIGDAPTAPGAHP